jgi:hypothetical protein
VEHRIPHINSELFMLNFLARTSIVLRQGSFVPAPSACCHKAMFAEMLIKMG